MKKLFFILLLTFMIPWHECRAADITPEEVTALGEALQDEYKAQATYRAVIERFGEVRPFSNIVHAERRHINALLGLYNTYQIEPPQNKWQGETFYFNSLGEACEAAAQAEIDNAAIYDELFKHITKSDIQRVFANLRSASIDRHLRAFRRCASRSEDSYEEFPF